MTVKLCNYSVSEYGYLDLVEVCNGYNYKKVVLIGGKRALNAASFKIRKALENSNIKVLGEFVYGDECTLNNINKLVNTKEVQDADVIFIVGGGKAMDTGKIVAQRLNKNSFSFPTICSNCAAVTAIAVIYNDDKSFLQYEKIPAPVHMFIETEIIAQAPYEYLWAGIGDGLSKEAEVVYATKDAQLDHTASMGLAISKTCEEPFLKYGKQAIEDCKSNKATKSIEEVTMDILVSTGYVSNLTISNDYYYNSSLAHIFYNTSTAIKRSKEHLHGEVVAFGVMVLHAYANQREELDKIAKFNKEVGLPVTLEDISLSLDDLEKMAQAAPETMEWKSSDEAFSKEKYIQAIKDADEYGRSLK